MSGLQSTRISCPYCGETIEITVDCSIPRQTYIEDCAVCCRPISLDVSFNETLSITVRHENE